MTAAPILDSLGIAEDAILAALSAIPATWPAKWGALHPDVAAALRQPTSSAGQRVYLAQHQDGGGDRRPYLGAQPWEGLVLVKVFARTAGDARAGLPLIATAMAALTSPAGYRISATYLRPVELPRELIHGRGALYRVNVRRTA